MTEREAHPLTVAVVLYGTSTLDLRWIPDGAPVVLVHNDRSFERIETEHDLDITHIENAQNIGFGVGANAAIRHVSTKRVAIVNPDVVCSSEHWRAFADGAADEVTVLPLRDQAGTMTSVVNPYPTPIAQVGAGLRVGRLAPRGSRRRAALSALAGGWAARHEHLQTVTAGRWPLTDYWFSGAAFAVDVSILHDVGGFSEEYFLYYEDLDLSSRLAERHPEISINMPSTEPAIHAVGATATDALAVACHRADGAYRYASVQKGVGWSLAARTIGIRRSLLHRRARLRSDL